MKGKEVIVIGSGFAGLTCAALLAKEGLKVTVLEQNYLPGGCTSSYWRKGFVFEAGATTVVGMDPAMPLNFVVDQLGIEIPMRKLKLPMKVYLSDNTVLRRHQDLDQWVKTAKDVFSGNQEGFWKECMKVSQFVWNSSTRYRQFPPTRWSDYGSLLRNFDFSDLNHAKYALISTQRIMEKYQVASPAFTKFVNEQLLITAQNNANEVNFLFGAAALCYTNYSNYYIDGGLINLVNPLIKFIEKNEGKIQYRTGVKSIRRGKHKYFIDTTKGKFESDFVVSGIPMNNTLQLFDDLKIDKRKVLSSPKLNGAFQMGIGFKSEKEFESLHHQIHLNKPLAQTGSNSIFLSLSHADDQMRSDLPNHRVASISTHVSDPERSIIDGEEVEKEIIDNLEKWDFLTRSDIVYQHSSTPKSWHKWTRREWGFVGGYPQYMDTKPWQMLDARLDRKKAYICGDTTYPGQGIPGTALSGIIASEKLKADWL